LEAEASMHKINDLFEKVIDELWDIKRYNSKIDLKELVDFYKEYKFHANLAIDAINAQVIQYDGLDMPFSEEDISYMIEAFITFNKYDYDRLLIETLFVLNNTQAYQYLNKILDTDEKRIEFNKEFQRWPHFKRVKEALKELGNEI
jgi:hypothetical protein